MSLKYTVIEVFCSEEMAYQGTPLHEAIVDFVRSLKIAARCLVFKATEGCFENGEVATPNILELSYNMPLRIEIVLPSAERDRVLPALETMISQGIVGMRELELYSFKARGSLLPRQIKVKDVMTPEPKTVQVSTPIKEIIQLLSYSNFYGIPVVDEDQRPVGIITELDLIERAGLPLRVGLLSEADWAYIDPALESIAHRQAQEMMTRPVITIGAEDLLTNAVNRMLEKGLKRLPVVDLSGKLVGMLSRWDIFRTITEVSPDWQSMAQQNVEVGNLRYVSDIMRRDTQTVLPGTSIEEIVHLVDANDIQRIAVTDEDNRYLGLISDRDLLAVFANHYPGFWARFAGKVLFAQKGERHKLVGEALRSKTAVDIMRTDLPTVEEHTGLDQAIKLMVTKGVKRLPVVDADGRFKGMLNRSALLHTGFGDPPS